MRSRLFAPILLLLLLAPTAGAVGPGTPPAAAPAFASPLFERVWARNDGPVAAGSTARSWTWGPGPGIGGAEEFTGAPGGSRAVQYFDKGRMEVNHAVGDPNSQWAVSSGLLVVELVAGRVQTGPDGWVSRSPAEIPVAGDDANGDAPTYRSFRDLASLPGGPDRRAPDVHTSPVTATLDRAGAVGGPVPSDVLYSRYAPQTGHNIPDVFDHFMAMFDPLYIFGYPITEAYWADVPISGKPTRVLVQLYQRRVLTYIPGYSPAWQVQMGNVGRHYYAWRYGPTAPPFAGTHLPPSGSHPTADSFVRVDGSQFVYMGQRVQLKGTNYWLHLDPFAGTWDNWDGPIALQELARARDLGVNTIRIGLPYDNKETSDVVWGAGCGEKDSDPRACSHVNGWIANQMTQLLQIASVYGMKVIFVPFDWSDNFPAPGTDEYQKQLNYLLGVVAPFANDDRVLAWDLHNEPDNYPTWNDPPDHSRVISWAQNIAGVIRQIDTNHPLTIGVGNYSDLWAAANGQTLLDAVDFASFHCYDAGGLRTQMDAIRAHTPKPILLEEMGWPSGPDNESTPAATYTEAVQQYLYRTMLADARASDLAGVVQWTLQDFPPGITNGYKHASHEEWFGLFRLDGSPKPAAATFRDGYPARILPSITQTNVKLTPGRRE
ncbi:MAG: cellulase family glycosylhydrolase [Chloroflexia bacterium]